jgi:hypothetical protein
MALFLIIPLVLVAFTIPLVSMLSAVAEPIRVAKPACPLARRPSLLTVASVEPDPDNGHASRMGRFNGAAIGGGSGDGGSGEVGSGQP